jgi:hypothetical protein
LLFFNKPPFGEKKQNMYKNSQQWNEGEVLVYDLERALPTTQNIS